MNRKRFLKQLFSAAIEKANLSDEQKRAVKKTVKFVDGQRIFTKENVKVER